MGDAENDLPPMNKALFTGCPADAIEEVQENANYISEFEGGRGAVYEFCMHIYNENDKENR
jgi:3-deoxy-D-manno-octulosonate 8-phosphate phosphatase (KDO 8-P phosphatase)